MLAVSVLLTALRGAALTIPAVISLAPDSLQLKITVPARVRAGEPVPVSLRVTNHGNAPVTLYLQGRPIAFEVVVRRTSGDVVWRRLEGATVAMILQVRTLAPGESLGFNDVWSQQTRAGTPVKPGDYTVTAELPIEGHRPLRTTSVPLHIDPP